MSNTPIWVVTSEHHGLVTTTLYSTEDTARALAVWIVATATGPLPTDPGERERASTMYWASADGWCLVERHLVDDPAYDPAALPQPARPSPARASLEHLRGAPPTSPARAFALSLAEDVACCGGTSVTIALSGLYWDTSHRRVK
jgi:hypothetical protein